MKTLNGNQASVVAAHPKQREKSVKPDENLVPKAVLMVRKETGVLSWSGKEDVGSFAVVIPLSQRG